MQENAEENPADTGQFSWHSRERVSVGCGTAQRCRINDFTFHMKLDSEIT